MALGATTVQPAFYYQLTSWIVAGSALITVLQAHDRNRTMLMWLFLFIAVIYNPFAPLSFSPAAWQIVHITTILIFSVVIFSLHPGRLKVKTA